MKRLLMLERWGDAHHPKWLDILRICFGLFLTYKGIQLINNINSLEDLMTNKLSTNTYGLVVLSHFVVFAHIIGGFMIAIGMFTRIACLVQIPILVGALFFINSRGNVFSPFSEFMVTLIVLILLFVFMIVGSGPWSVNRFIDQENSMHVNT